MASGDNDDDEDRQHRAGIAESSEAERQLLLDWSIPLGSTRTSAGDFLAPPLISSRPRSSDGKVTFHFQHSFISKIPRSPGGAAIQDRDGRQIQLSKVLGREVLSKYPDLHNGLVRSRELPASNYAVRTAGQARKTFLADVRDAAVEAATWEELNAGLAERGYSVVKTGSFLSASARLPGAAAAHQAYIERGGRWTADRESIELDDDGHEISFGTIGETFEERLEFWRKVEKLERENGRVQCRMVVELPHELTPSGRRRLIDDFMLTIGKYALPWHAISHRPDMHSDPRNFHLHAVYLDRPAVRIGPREWKFQRVKERATQGRKWIHELRRMYSIRANIALEREGHEKRYDHRTYEEMGIQKSPTVHLGPGASALERAGIPTEVGVEVVRHEKAFEEYDDAKRVVDGFGAALSRTAWCLEMPPGKGFYADALRTRVLEVANEWLEVECERIKAVERESVIRRELRDRLGREMQRDEQLKKGRSSRLIGHTAKSFTVDRTDLNAITARAAKLDGELLRTIEEWKRQVGIFQAEKQNQPLQASSSLPAVQSTTHVPRKREIRTSAGREFQKVSEVLDLGTKDPLVISDDADRRVAPILLGRLGRTALQHLAYRTLVYVRADREGRPEAVEGMLTLIGEAKRRGVKLGASFDAFESAVAGATSPEASLTKANPDAVNGTSTINAKPNPKTAPRRATSPRSVGPDAAQDKASLRSAALKVRELTKPGHRPKEDQGEGR